MVHLKSLKTCTFTIFSLLFFFTNFSSAFSHQEYMNPRFWLGRENEYHVDDVNKRLYWFDKKTGKVRVSRFAEEQFVIRQISDQIEPSEVIDETPEPSQSSRSMPEPHIEKESKSQTPERTNDEVQSTVESEPAGTNSNICLVKNQVSNKNDLVKSIGRIRESNGGSCNAWKTAAGQIMTNHHCVAESISATDKCRKKFAKPLKGGGYQIETSNPKVKACYLEQDKAQAKRKLKNPIEAEFLVNGKSVKAKCTQIEALNATLDYAALSCPGLPTTIPAVKFSSVEPQVGDTLTLATWDFGWALNRKNPDDSSTQKTAIRSGRMFFLDRCSPKDQHCINERDSGSERQADIHIQTGNSGSAIYNQNGEVVGLANVFDERTKTSQRSGKAGFNKISSVLESMKQGFPEAYSKISQQARCSGDSIRTPGRKAPAGLSGQPTQETQARR